MAEVAVAWPIVALMGGALLAAALAIAAILLRHRPWRGPRTRYPIVLCHGLMGFDRLGIGAISTEYFRGVAAHLESLGNTVFSPTVPSAASVEERASALNAAVRALGVPRVNLIAHSMGGLDARYAISRLGLAQRVHSLTTIGTPHRGTKAADVGNFLMRALFGRHDLQAVKDMTCAAMHGFNEVVPNMPRVRYGSVLATIGQKKAHRLLRPTLMLLNSTGASDGMVPEASQRWGRILLRVEADHWGQVGWSKSCDAPLLYEQLAHQIRAQGG